MKTRKAPILILSWVEVDPLVRGGVRPYSCCWSSNVADLMSGVSYAMTLPCGLVEVTLPEDGPHAVAGSGRGSLVAARAGAMERARLDRSQLRGLATSPFHGSTV